MDLKKTFVVRPTNEEEKEFMITIGNHLATEQTFKSRKAAQMAINKTDWNLVAAFAQLLKEAEEWEKNNKKTEKITEE